LALAGFNKAIREPLADAGPAGGLGLSKATAEDEAVGGLDEADGGHDEAVGGLDEAFAHDW
jgi:hypothetical protein